MLTCYTDMFLSSMTNVCIDFVEVYRFVIQIIICKYYNYIMKKSIYLFAQIDTTIVMLARPSHFIYTFWVRNYRILVRGTSYKYLKIKALNKYKPVSFPKSIFLTKVTHF